jgi:hypothetical protein
MSALTASRMRRRRASLRARSAASPRHLLRVALLGATAAIASRAAAQDHVGRADRVSGAVAHVQLGSYVPLGALRRGFGPAVLVGVQGNVRLAKRVGAVLTMSGAQVRDEREFARPEWYLWQYDVGLEASAGHAGRLRHPALFVGAGAGGRTYNRVGPERGTRSALAGYASGGVEVRAARTGLRLESRLYVSQPGGQPDGRAIRADLGVTAGLAYHFR